MTDRTLLTLAEESGFSRTARTEEVTRLCAAFAPAPFEGRMRVELTGSWQRQIQDIAAGALFVPIAQPCARLLLHLLEPQARIRSAPGLLQRLLRGEGASRALRRRADRPQPARAAPGARD